MPNVLKDDAREGFLGGDLAWDTDAFKIVLLTADYVYDDAHVNLDDIATGRLWTSSALTGKSKTAGVADAADVVTSALTAGDTVTQVWLFHDSGSEATSTLVGYYDEDASGAPLSVPTNGQPITVEFNNGTYKLFKI